MPSIFTRLRNLFDSEDPLALPSTDAGCSACPGAMMNDDERARQAAPRTDLPHSASPFRSTYGAQSDRFGSPRAFADPGPPSSSMRQNGAPHSEFSGPGRFY